MTYVEKESMFYSVASGLKYHKLPVAVSENHGHMVVLTHCQSSLQLSHECRALKQQYVPCISYIPELFLSDDVNL